MKKLPTCEPDVAAHFQVLDGLLLAAGEAVDDAVGQPVPVPRQELHHLGVRVSLVEEQRLFQITGQLNLKNMS